MVDDTVALDGFERQFRRAGLPSLISEFSAKNDVFTRAAPFLLLVLVLEPLNAMDSEWSWWENALAVVASAAILWLVLALLNRARSGSWAVRPKTVGRVELAAFVILPSLVPLVLGGNLAWALGTALFNIVILALTYLFIANGFLMTAWATLRRSRHELASSARKLTLALPVLLVFSIVLFVNADMWQIFDQMHGSAMIGLTLLFGGLIIAFVSARITPQVQILEKRLGLGGSESPSLSRRQRRNVRLLFLVSQLLHVMFISGGVAIFFLIFGVLTVTTDVLDTWKLEAVAWLLDLRIGDAAFTLSSTHLRVALAIGTFTGLYYAISIMTNDSYREEFLDGMTDELAPIFAARITYLALTLEASPEPAKHRRSDSR